MNCRLARARLVALIDDELAPGEAMQVQHHLHGCTACTGRLDALEATLPKAPVIELDPHARHAMHLSLDRVLDNTAPIPAARPRSLAGLRNALGAEVGVPRGLLLLYAAALVLAVGWAAGRVTPPGDVDALTRNSAESDTAANLELHRPAAYVPEGGWF